VLVAVPLALGLGRVSFDAEVLNLLPHDLPVVEALRLQQRHFPAWRELIITVRARAAEEADAAAPLLAEALRSESGLTASVVWQPPWLEHPDHGAEMLACLWLNQPPEQFARLASRCSPSNLPATLATRLERLRASLSPVDLAMGSQDPCGLTELPDVNPAPSALPGQGENWFASPDGAFRVLYVQPPGELRGYKACAAWLAQVQGIIERTRRSPEWPAETAVACTGGPAFVTEVATGMEKDLRRSVLGTLVIIGVLFWWAHRRWRPLLGLLALLALIFAGTMAAGGLVFGTLNLLSFGFAAVLLGLSVDYAMVLYQEARAAPEKPAAELRRQMAPGVLWSAATTAGAFAMLNFGALPGLAQMGTLVALGIGLAAVVMLAGFLRLAGRGAARLDGRLTASGRGEHSKSRRAFGRCSGPFAARWGSVLLVAAAAAFVMWRPPSVDHSASALEPTHSPAYAALEEIKSRLGQMVEPVSLLVTGRDEGEVARRLANLEPVLRQAVARGQLTDFTLPTALWPQPDRQQTNRALAGRLAAQQADLRAAVLAAGFTTNALGLTEAVLGVWREAAADSRPRWPTNDSSRWLLDKVAARTADGWLALGLIRSATNASALRLTDLRAGLEIPGVWLAGWPLLGEGLLRRVEARLPWLVAGTLALVTLCLWLAFGRWAEVFLSFGSLGLSLLVLLAVMSLAGWSWNLLNLTALPLLFGTGVDYTIHVQLALRRHGGDAAAMRGITGRALLLCAGTTAAGFGSLAWAGNAGLASLGRVCAVGVAAVWLVSLLVLPVWWRWLRRDCSRAGGATKDSSISPARPPARLRQPSLSYRAEVWRLGLWAARVLPSRLCHRAGEMTAGAYRRLRPQRHEIVVQNLLPVCGGDRAAAERTARALFRQFAVKLVDLWRVEAGLPLEAWAFALTGWDTFAAALTRGRGALLLTPHLGNWEIGGPLLARRGVKLVAITQPEPGGLTALRQTARARWGVETVVIGQDTFAFVEVIKRLQEGAVVALLLDRPPPATAVTVELFGRPFLASVAAAELARASGCALFGVHVVRSAAGYQAHLMPEFAYDRAALGDREARRQLTQQILRAFEPAIRQHLDQWYHFVPLWPEAGTASTAGSRA
jgi:predicted exporter/lauroyl/myristoyl acyltransferase